MSYVVDSNGRASAALEVQAGVASGETLDVKRLKGPKHVQIGGTGWTGTLLVRYSLNGGTDWETQQTFTGVGVCVIDAPASHVKVETTVAFAGGIATATLVAFAEG